MNSVSATSGSSFPMSSPPLHLDGEARLVGCNWRYEMGQQLPSAEPEDVPGWAGLRPAVVLFMAALCPATFGSDTGHVVGLHDFTSLTVGIEGYIVSPPKTGRVSRPATKPTGRFGCASVHRTVSNLCLLGQYVPHFDFDVIRGT